MTVFHVAAHALIRRDGRFLATRRSAANDYRPLLWDLPGGTVEPGETLEQALVREVAEETSLAITAPRLLHAYTNLDGFPGRQTVQCVFACDHAGGEVRLDPAEHDRHAWLTLPGLASLELIAFAREAVGAVDPAALSPSR